MNKVSKHAPSIFQGKFDFNATPRGISLAVEHPLERRAFQILGIALLVLALGYMYFISASVLNVIARKEALAGLTKAQSAIGSMEKQHFTLSHEVTPDAGTTLGLTAVESTHYVYRPGNVGAATIARNAI